jgi:integrase/recombinase XerD
MNIDKAAVLRFSDNLKAHGKQPSTVESYARDAQQFLDYLDKRKISPHLASPSTLVEYQSHLVDERKEKENSMRRTVIGIRQFYRFLGEEKFIEQTPFDDVPIPERNDRLPIDLKQDDIERVIQLATNGVGSLKTARDAAIVTLLSYEGLKATELIALCWSNYLGGNAGATLYVKGTRARTLNLSERTVKYLEQYRSYYEKFCEHPVIKADKEKRMFISFKGKDGVVPIPHMTRHGLKFIIYELGEKAGVKHLNAELLRHYAVSNLLGFGRSPEEIMKHLGLRRMGNIAKHMARNHCRVSE